MVKHNRPMFASDDSIAAGVRLGSKSILGTRSRGDKVRRNLTYNHLLPVEARSLSKGSRTVAIVPAPSDPATVMVAPS